MTDEQPQLDRALLLATLVRHRVKFILVGGLAAQAHGALRATKDADICPQWDRENLTLLSNALTELNARLRIGEGSIDTLMVEIDAHTIDGMEIGGWRTTAGDVDVLLGIPRTSRFELARYEALATSAVELQIDSILILVASLADIIRSKEVADRPKDRLALEELRTLLALRVDDEIDAP